ncbi:hypothetical protein HPP92_007654 [Vanilla planifolia]|uniref:Uncharacterized protein n=1 Tax=Vanilla planifolia TaxID=51239 RepID=A0A835RB78_VANPL|nr:hypothetical protein HPP92_007861 [Vanilla planifolia]KAG0490791.1 hypothetical protein HPP92_007654 [Vanilla planifolia]
MPPHLGACEARRSPPGICLPIPPHLTPLPTPRTPVHLLRYLHLLPGVVRPSTQPTAINAIEIFSGCGKRSQSVDRTRPPPAGRSPHRVVPP